MGKDKKKGDPDKGIIIDGYEFLPSRYFEWGSISKSVNMSSVMKVKTNKKKSWKPYFIILHYNYIALYKPGKAKTGEPADTDVAKELVMLELVNNPVTNHSEKGHSFCFVVPTTVDTYTFECNSENQMNDWINTVKTTVELVKEIKRETEEVIMTKIKEIQRILPDNLVLPAYLDADQADKWIDDINRAKEEYRKWSPYMMNLNLFADHQIGRIKAYSTFFLTKIRDIIDKSEEQVSGNWEKTILKAMDDMRTAYETMFYREDFEYTIKDCEKAIKMVDAYNKFLTKVRGSTEPKYLDEKATLESWIVYFKGCPSMNDPILDSYESGIVKVKQGPYNELWQWDQNTKTLSRLSSQNIQAYELPEVIEFASQGPSQLVSKLFGIILWNATSWVWTHPRCPFVLRFDWDDTLGGFKEYASLSKDAKKKQSQAPVLPDWIYNGSSSFKVASLVPKETTPQESPITEWAIEGNIPPPVALTVANFWMIKKIFYGQ